MFNECLIMAGGSGVRLWPASSSAKPKQFLSINAGSGQTFFSASVDRALTLSPDGRVIIIAGKSHLPHVIADCARLGSVEKERLILIAEPEAKNTAPAIACALVYAALTGGGKPTDGPDRNMLVLTSDHIIRPAEVFAHNAAAAADFAGRGWLAVFGIPPTRPETGYGYIETADTLAEGVRAVAAFREKPDFPDAKRFAASEHFFWNSGMFAFTLDFMAAEFRRSAPEVFGPFEELTAPPQQSYSVTGGLRVLDNWPGLDKAYRKTKSISFDYAIAEKCARTVMVRAGFDWIDVGNWEEYARLLASGGAGSEVYRAGAAEQSCFVDSDIPVALAGVEDLIVVIRAGKNGAAALVTRKGETQRVRDIVEQIKKAGRSELL